MFKVKDDSRRLFTAWGTVEMVDKDREIIPISEFERVMPILMKRGGVLMDSHTNRHVGKILSWKKAINPITNTPGIIIEGEIFRDNRLDDQVWKEIKEGQREGLSFGGADLPHLTKYNADGNAVLGGVEGFEFSVVGKPANPESKFIKVNTLAKGDGGEVLSSLIFKISPITKGPKCMMMLKERGFSETDAHNICYADDISSGQRDPMVEKKYTKTEEKSMTVTKRATVEDVIAAVREQMGEDAAATLMDALRIPQGVVAQADNGIQNPIHTPKLPEQKPEEEKREKPEEEKMPIEKQEAVVAPTKAEEEKLPMSVSDETAAGDSDEKDQEGDKVAILEKELAELKKAMSEMKASSTITKSIPATRPTIEVKKATAPAERSLTKEEQIMKKLDTNYLMNDDERREVFNVLAQIEKQELRTMRGF